MTTIAPPPPISLEEPIRAELFGIERLEQHAESLAAAQRVTGPGDPGRPLAPRVQENGQALREAYQAVSETVRDEGSISPAAEWFVDNFHVVDAQLREIRSDLPAAFYRKLPKLAEGPLAGFPRVYGIAWAFAAHTDSRFDPDTLRRFLQAYQRIAPLTIGELWGVPIMLRVILVENLRRLAQALAHRRAARQLADRMADELVGSSNRTGKSAASVLSRLEDAPLESAFAAELVQRLRDQDPATTPALLWLDRRLAAQGTTRDDIVLSEHQQQASTTVTVRNVITSMRLLSSLDWPTFFESVSLVDEILRQDSEFAAMDFISRDRYRHAVEELARGLQSDDAELLVAREVVRHAQQARTQGGEDAERRGDPGFYLVGGGRFEFERMLGFRPSLFRRLLRLYVAAAAPGYLGTIFVLTALILGWPLELAARAGLGTGGLVLLGILALIPASDVAIALLNGAVTALLPPRILPRLELRDGIPAELRSMVVVPTLLSNGAEVHEHAERLEVHYLANPEGDVHYALLSDWSDAPTERVAGDEELLESARDAIRRLNERHGPAPNGHARFFVLHRRRVWNERQGSWMGWERKRGKLHELNRLLRGATDTTFLPVNGSTPVPPPGVRYVITLDADTRLPIGAVKRLIGTMAHGLNRPRLDPATRRVVAGYGVLQPRVTPPLPAHESSLFQRISSGPSGIDPYAAAVSDVYQDVFGEGSYTGKGIYDVDAFETALRDRVPENALLSHDLFEGLFARAGLVTDIELFEPAPATYGAAATRQHRWARGDWQLVPWIFRVPVPAIGRWKMLDNLRRTLLAPAGFLTLVAGWLVPAAAPLVWTGFIVGTISLPPLLPVLAGLAPRGPGFSKRSYLRGVGRDFALAGAQIGFAISVLAHQAWLMAEAITRTLIRVFVTHKNLLVWITAAQAEAAVRLDLAEFLQQMSGGLVLAAAAGLLVWSHPAAWPVALPFLVLWAGAPVLARWFSLPRVIAPAPVVAPADARALRLIARETWRFFATFVGPEDHYLPPDNFQETPEPVVAHRTSPTNIGLYLLSVLAARDLGWIGTLEALERIEATLEAMNGLERYQGHLYNWYDTSDGHPLEPRYVSSVDSGNLAGSLMVLRSACLERVDRPILDEAALAGIGDAVLLLREKLSDTAGPELESALAAVEVALVERPVTSDEWMARLTHLDTTTARVASFVREMIGDEPEGARADILAWADALHATVESHARDLDALMPWVRIPHAESSAALALIGSAPPPVGEVSQRSEAVLRALSPGAEPLAEGVERGAAVCETLIERLRTIATTAETMASEMAFGFLFDPMRKLLALGVRVADGSLDSGRYDLLASEARLASFIAIAKGEVPVAHWFHLGRPLTPVGRDSALLSWSGSMFEYLMPELMMHEPPGGLLEQTCRLVVQRQISYGAEHGVPWGVSESGFNGRNLEMTYQYANFGVPGLGFRRRLADDLVIAPYATGLAAMIDPAEAARNFERLADLGARGPYGFYEAVDFTPTRLPAGSRWAVVRSYMAHHQGMLLIGIVNALRDGVMRTRFHADPMIQASELLLQERTPRDVPVARRRWDDAAPLTEARDGGRPIARRFTSPHGTPPRTQLLSNGRYAVMLTAAGSGYSRWRDLAVTRWREDPTRDAYGSYIFLRDIASGETWSAGFQPRAGNPDSYAVTFHEDRAEIVRRDGSITTQLEVIVSPEDDGELRRVSLTNRGVRTREIEVTSYAEVVLAPPAADAAHPAFSNLFVQTECVPERAALLATRRPRAEGETPLWLLHVITVEGETTGDLQWETDRARFVGRGRAIRNPLAMIDRRPLSNTTGSVLDPVVSLRRRVRIPPGQRVRVTYSTLVASSREKAIDLADTYSDPRTFERAAMLAWVQSQMQLHHFGVSPDEAHLFQTLASFVVHANRGLRAGRDLLTRPLAGPGALWAHGISGDLPIVLVQIDEAEDAGIVRLLLRAHEYWRAKRLAVDLVILNDRAASYVQDLQSLLETLVRTSRTTGHGAPDSRGQVFILRSEQLTAPQRDVLHAVARVVLSSRGGTLTEQLRRAQRPDPPLAATPRRAPSEVAPVSAPLLNLQFWNGLGGFTRDGREYVIVFRGGEWTPAPWINVIANPTFGFQVSESGSGYTWSLNSHENQLTPWSNDPVCDPPGEAFYVQDEDSGELWGPTALPIREQGGHYVVRHGQGYSRFAYTAHDVALELLQFVPEDDPIKISRLTLVNRSTRPRRLSVTAYVEWVLGAVRGGAAPFVTTELDGDTKALFARNAWNATFGTRVAFADLAGAQDSWTADRAEFIGRNGTLEQPAALVRRERLSGRVGAALDPCGALQTSVELPPGGKAEVTLFLGQGATREAARELIQRYRTRDLDASLEEVVARWNAILGTVQVTTPDPALDLMLNRWLLYQTLVCRYWARSAFYQASGAYGFRDQLQDVMALAVARPDIARRHILRAAARQFVEGDVQHWWHPAVGRGVRTRISDDLLWLPYVLNHYLEVTGDHGVLDEAVPFLEGPLLAPEEHEAYYEPRVSQERASLFEHAARAMDRSLTTGRHGLPLMGTGDWNDGMNRVGAGGKGESVWLGWFLHTVLMQWTLWADRRGERARAETWRSHAARLKIALEQHGWDGDWYRRAYFDDGMPLGSRTNDACRIDSIAQTWSVISGAADPARARCAMASLDEQLVHRTERLILLLTPPFADTPLEPGYIKGYLAGVRENGGQYTHAATWAVMAFAMLGDGDRATELLGIINPVGHASTQADVQRYKVEPYVVAADVYSEPPHVGRGGWTWYTGSAGWTYQVGLEWVLGLRVRGARLVIDPCIPRSWPGFSIALRYRSTQYEIAVQNPSGVSRGVRTAELDSAKIDSHGSADIPLVDDGGTHRVRIVLG